MFYLAYSAGNLNYSSPYHKCFAQFSELTNYVWRFVGRCEPSIVAELSNFVLGAKIFRKSTNDADKVRIRSLKCCRLEESREFVLHNTRQSAKRYHWGLHYIITALARGDIFRLSICSGRFQVFFYRFFSLAHFQFLLFNCVFPIFKPKTLSVDYLTTNLIYWHLSQNSDQGRLMRRTVFLRI